MSVMRNVWDCAVQRGAVLLVRLMRDARIARRRCSAWQWLAMPALRLERERERAIFDYRRRHAARNEPPKDR